jgi:hypothetical protein
MRMSCCKFYEIIQKETIQERQSSLKTDFLLKKYEPVFFVFLTAVWAENFLLKTQLVEDRMEGQGVSKFENQLMILNKLNFRFGQSLEICDKFRPLTVQIGLNVTNSVYCVLNL